MTYLLRDIHAHEQSVFCEVAYKRMAQHSLLVLFDFLISSLAGHHGKTSATFPGLHCPLVPVVHNCQVPRVCKHV